MSDAKDATQDPAEGAPRAPSLEALEAVHTFPTAFIVKAVGANTKAFSQAVEQCVRAAVQPAIPVFTSRPSRSGSYQSITIEFRAATPQQVQSVYIDLHNVEGLRMLL